jgi:hypothetical protein
MADARDLKSLVQTWACRFESGLRHFKWAPRAEGEAPDRGQPPASFPLL